MAALVGNHSSWTIDSYEKPEKSDVTDVSQDFEDGTLLSSTSSNLSPVPSQNEEVSDVNETSQDSKANSTDTESADTLVTEERENHEVMTQTTPQKGKEAMDNSIVENIEKNSYQVDGLYDTTKIDEKRDSIQPRPKRKKSSDDDEYVDDKLTTIISPQPVRNKRVKAMNESQDSQYVDITNLLPLPQKEAANLLGISESMLCKRFKESTKRKWPFRFLKKIEKTIKSLEHSRKQGSITQQDQLKLDDLLLKKDECLAPVRIRITNHDRIALSRSPSPRIESDDDLGSESDDELAVELLRSLSPFNNKSNN